MPNKRLFIDADSIITPRPSGIGSMTIQLIRVLSKDTSFTDEYDIIIVTPFNKIKLVEQWNFENILIRRLPLTGRMVAVLVRFRLLPPVDLFLGRGIYLFTNFRNWPLLFSKSITYIHDVSYEVFPEFTERKNLAYLRRNVRRWMNRTDTVITVSEHAKKEIIRFYPEVKNKIDVVYNGVDSSFVLRDKAQINATLSSYGLVYKEYFMFLSNIEPRKNLRGLLAAYKQFLTRPGNEHTKLLLVGGMGWSNAAILKDIAAINQLSKNVIIPNNYVPDIELPDLLSGAAALLHPAHYEGFGISPLQAMACGTQLVVADNSSIPEVVGEGGVYIDSNNIKDLVRAMEVVYNKRYEVNTAGIKQATNFTWRKSARQLIRIIRTLER